MSDPNEPDFCDCCAEYNGIGGCCTFCFICCCTTCEFLNQCNLPDHELIAFICLPYFMCSFIPCGQCIFNLAFYKCQMSEYKHKHKNVSHEKLSWFKFLCMPACTPCFLLRMKRKKKWYINPIEGTNTSCIYGDVHTSNTMNNKTW